MTALNCQSCGACCRDPHASLHGVIAWVSPNEANKIRALGDHLLRRVRLGRKPDDSRDPEGLATARYGRCAALTGHVGRAVSCSIYDDRPKVCRVFAPGGPGCLSARKEARIS